MIYVLVFICLIASTTGHILFKKGIPALSEMPNTIETLIPFFWKAATNIYVILSAVAILIAALSWMIALSKYNLSYIYPVMGLSFVLVAISSAVYLKEPISIWCWVGVILITVGVCIVLRIGNSA